MTENTLIRKAMRLSFFSTGVLLFINLCWSNAQQNLVRNGSFEEHGEQKCLNCNTLFGQYSSIVYHWDNGGWGCLLCQKGYKRNSDEIKRKVCPMEEISPQNGKAMIEMWYQPDCGGAVNEGATYLSARTTQPMRVGQLYEVRFWLHIRSAKRHDPDWNKHIGIALLPQNIKTHGLYGKDLMLPFLSIDTALYDNWYQVKWRVRPLCTSNYLMIGVFEDNLWHQTRGYDDAYYYVDNISVVEIPGVSAVADSSVYYCSRYEPKTLGIPPQMDNEILLFQNRAFDLTTEHKSALDSFVVFARKYPDLVFEISGHTDSIGTDNLILSQKRAQSVYKYLTIERNIPVFRFITLGIGSKYPFRPNKTEEGRKLNRRVEIRQSNLNLPMIFYRNALRAYEEKNYAETFSYLNRWLIKYNSGMRMILSFDPRFETLQKDKRWSLIEKKVQDGYKSLKYPKYAFLFDSLRLERLKASGEEFSQSLNALSGHIPEIDSVWLELPNMPEDYIKRKNEEHFKMIRPILEEVGWPKKSEFGESAAVSAFFLLFESKDIVAYIRWLPALQKTCEEGEAPWEAYAMLYDQCNSLLGKPQRYLTGARILRGEVWLPPWEGDENTVNEQRAKIGMKLLPKAIVEAMRGNR
jgi:flagellar motor protein MotB